MGDEQTKIEEKKDNEGRWRKLDPPKQNSGDREPKGFVKLEIHESLEGIYLSAKPNSKKPEKEVYYIGSKDGKEFRGINETGDLKSWMKQVEHGDIIKITRIEDLDIGKPNPMHQFEVEIFELKE